MGISYGGHNLLYDDPDGHAGRWIATWQSLDDIRPCAETIARRSGMTGHRARQKDGRGLPIPNYPPPPPVRINSLYWPTGASRWATFFALADYDTMAAIYKAYRLSVRTIGSQTPARMLKLFDGKETIETEMHLLSARRITTAREGDSLWLIPMVDVRYFWGVQNAGEAEPDNTLADIATALGVTITVDPPAAAYGRLDFTELNRRYHAAGVLIDAVCHSQGLRFVRRFNGDCVAINYDSSESDHTTYNLVDFHQAAGGEWFAAPVPEAVVTTFRLYRDGIVQDQDWDSRASVNDFMPDPIATKEYTAATHFGGTPAQGVVDDWGKTVHSTMYAIISHQSNERNLPTNDTEIQELADQIGMDYYDWNSRQHDFTFVGLKEWKPTGFDDHVEIRFDGEEAFTRVQSFTPEFGCDVNCSQTVTDVYIFDECVFAVANGTIPKLATLKMGQGTAFVYERIPNVDADDITLEDTEIEVKAFNPFDYDVTGFVILKKIDCLWVVIQASEWAKPQTEDATPP